MEVKLQSKDTFRVNGDYSNCCNFIDISKEGFSGIGMCLFTSFQYIEIRKKKDMIKVFTFPKKSHKKEHDFGYWEDAEIVFTLNEQYMHK